MPQNYSLRTREDLFKALEATYTMIRRNESTVDKAHVIVQIVGAARTLIEDEETNALAKKIQELEDECQTEELASAVRIYDSTQTQYCESQ